MSHAVKSLLGDARKLWMISSPLIVWISKARKRCRDNDPPNIGYVFWESEDACKINNDEKKSELLLYAGNFISAMLELSNNERLDLELACSHVRVR